MCQGDNPDPFGLAADALVSQNTASGFPPGYKKLPAQSTYSPNFDRDRWAELLGNAGNVDQVEIILTKSVRAPFKVVGPDLAAAEIFVRISALAKDPTDENQATELFEVSTVAGVAAVVEPMGAAYLLSSYLQDRSIDASNKASQLQAQTLQGQAQFRPLLPVASPQVPIDSTQYVRP